jgi:2-iminobutanoate/2-iminopropanoate deaminase
MSTGSPGKRVVAASNAPAAIGPYSQAIVAGGFVFTSGQIPLDPKTGAVAGDAIAAQTDQVMRNLGAVLEASGSSLARIVRTTCFLRDLNDFDGFNQVYARYFSGDPPARSTVQVARLPKDVLVEVDCVALVD